MAVRWVEVMAISRCWVAIPDGQVALSGQVEGNHRFAPGADVDCDLCQRQTGVVDREDLELVSARSEQVSAHRAGAEGLVVDPDDSLGRPETGLHR